MIGATGWCVWTTLQQEQLDRRIREWMAEAYDSNVQCYDRQLCVISGHEIDPIGRVLLGRREIMAIVYSRDDADVLLMMPECPIRMTVFTGRDLPEGQAERLRVRFGSENVNRILSPTLSSR